MNTESDSTSQHTFIIIFGLILNLTFLYIGYFPIYYAEFLPFYILSFPFEFFLFQYNSVIFGIITKNFMYFWTIPSSLYFIFYLSYYQLQSSRENFREFRDTEIKHKEIKWAVVHFMAKKELTNYFCEAYCIVMNFAFIFGLAFIYTFPLSSFMMIQGEFNE
jgi:hypothetical protein